MGARPEASIPAVGAVVAEHQNRLGGHHSAQGPATLAIARGAVAGDVGLFDRFAVDLEMAAGVHLHLVSGDGNHPLDEGFAGRLLNARKATNH